MTSSEMVGYFYIKRPTTDILVIGKEFEKRKRTKPPSANLEYIIDNVPLL